MHETILVTMEYNRNFFVTKKKKNEQYDDLCSDIFLKLYSLVFFLQLAFTNVFHLICMDKRQSNTVCACTYKINRCFSVLIYDIQLESISCKVGTNLGVYI